jgi:hypothetical protein
MIKKNLLLIKNLLQGARAHHEVVKAVPQGARAFL